MKLLYEGLLIGLGLSLMVGPLFFSILRHSIENGKTGGFLFVAGQWLSDFVLILLVSQVTKVIEFSESTKLYFIYVAAPIFILLGLSMVLKLGGRKSAENELHVGSVFFDGFLINFLNPFPWFFWASLLLNAQKIKQLDTVHIFYLCAGVFISIIVTDLIKVLLASKLRSFFDERRLAYLRPITGFILIAFGCLLMLNSL